MALNAKQKAFVAAYLIDKNATQAAIAAGYSKATAYAIGAENLRKPQIKAAIAAAFEKAAAKSEVTAERVIREISTLAFAQVNKKTIITQQTKVKCLEMLSKYFGLLQERHILETNAQSPISINLNLPDNGRIAPSDDGNDDKAKTEGT